MNPYANPPFQIGQTNSLPQRQDQTLNSLIPNLDQSINESHEQLFKQTQVISNTKIYEIMNVQHKDLPKTIASNTSNQSLSLFLTQVASPHYHNTSLLPFPKFDSSAIDQTTLIKVLCEQRVPPSRICWIIFNYRNNFNYTTPPDLLDSIKFQTLNSHTIKVAYAFFQNGLLDSDQCLRWIAHDVNAKLSKPFQSIIVTTYPALYDALTGRQSQSYIQEYSLYFRQHYVQNIVLNLTLNDKPSISTFKQASSYIANKRSRALYQLFEDTNISNMTLINSLLFSSFPFCSFDANDKLKKEIAFLNEEEFIQLTITCFNILEKINNITHPYSAAYYLAHVISLFQMKSFPYTQFIHFLVSCDKTLFDEIIPSFTAFLQMFKVFDFEDYIPAFQREQWSIEASRLKTIIRYIPFLKFTTPVSTWIFSTWKKHFHEDFLNSNDKCPTVKYYEGIILVNDAQARKKFYPAAKSVPIPLILSLAQATGTIEILPDILHELKQMLPIFIVERLIPIIKFENFSPSTQEILDTLKKLRAPDLSRFISVSPKIRADRFSKFAEKNFHLFSLHTYDLSKKITSKEQILCLFKTLANGFVEFQSLDPDELFKFYKNLIKTDLIQNVGDIFISSLIKSIRIYRPTFRIFIEFFTLLFTKKYLTPKKFLLLSGIDKFELFSSLVESNTFLFTPLNTLSEKVVIQLEKSDKKVEFLNLFKGKNLIPTPSITKLLDAKTIYSQYLYSILPDQILDPTQYINYFCENVNEDNVDFWSLWILNRFNYFTGTAPLRLSNLSDFDVSNSLDNLVSKLVKKLLNDKLKIFAWQRLCRFERFGLKVIQYAVNTLNADMMDKPNIVELLATPLRFHSINSDVLITRILDLAKSNAQYARKASSLFVVFAAKHLHGMTHEYSTAEASAVQMLKWIDTLYRSGSCDTCFVLDCFNFVMAKLFHGNNIIGRTDMTFIQECKDPYLKLDQRIRNEVILCWPSHNYTFQRTNDYAFTIPEQSNFIQQIPNDAEQTDQYEDAFDWYG